MKTLNINKMLFILNLFGTLNYYKGLDKLTIWDYIYKRRLSLKTAIEIANIIYPKD